MCVGEPLGRQSIVLQTGSCHCRLQYTHGH